MLIGVGSTQQNVIDVARQNSVSGRSLWRWVALYRNAPSVSTLLAPDWGTRSRAYLLNLKVESIIRSAVDDLFLARPKTRYETAHLSPMIGSSRKRRSALQSRPPAKPAQWISHQMKDRAALIAIQEFESTITRALAGRHPSASRWRPIEADKFLRVIRDVAAFALTNFSGRSMAPICTMDVNRFACSYPIGGFARRLKSHAPWSIDAAANTLTQVGDPGLRRCALFWTRELMHAASARLWIDVFTRSNRARRQAEILERQASDGLAWLASRMEHCPAQYRDRWWPRTRILGMNVGNLVH